MLHDSRIAAQERLIEAAREKGGEAILAMRFDADDFGDSGQKICAYGTVVRIRKL